MNTRQNVLGCLLFAGAIGVAGFADALNSIVPPRTAEEARAVAMRFVGLDLGKQPGAGAAASTASLLEVPDDRTPFVHDRIQGHRVWKVGLKGARLAITDTVGRDLQVLIDSATGSLLTLSSGLDYVDSTVPPLVPASQSTRQLIALGERYEIPYGVTPDLSFSEICMTTLNGIPAKAPQLTAQFVYWTRNNHPRALVWIVTVRGTAPQPVANDPEGHIPVYERNQWRFVIDASTGKELWMTNVPHNNPASPGDTLSKAK